MSTSLIYFNSTKVQFGGIVAEDLVNKLLDFNSTKVQFGVQPKHHPYTKNGISIPLRYNLERRELEEDDNTEEDFNSTKVQFGAAS